jgi:hypothetical protein
MTIDRNNERSNSLEQAKKQNVPKRHEPPLHTSEGACGWQMNIIRKSIESWMDKHGDGQFTSNHQSSDDNCNDI